MQTTANPIRLDDPRLLLAAQAAGYKSKRLGPALFVLEVLGHRAGGDEALAMRLLEEAVAAVAPTPASPIACACAELAVPAEKWAAGPRVLFGSPLLHSPEACSQWPGEEQDQAEIVASA